MKPGAWIITGVLGTALATGLGAAQPQQPEKQTEKREQPDRAEGRQEFPTDPAQAKKFLERRIEETTKREEHFKALLARLEKGEKPADVGKDLEGSGRGGAHDATRRTGEPGQRTDHQGARARIQPEDREHALAFLRENSPMLGTRFDNLVKSDPEAADRILGHMMGRIREAEKLKDSNQPLFGLKIREMEGGAAVVDALRVYRDAKNATPQDPARLGQATEQLRTALARQLDVRLSLQENEIDSLTKRLADLKADLDKKRTGKEEAINSMVQKVKDGKDLREGDGDRRAPGSDRPEATKAPPPAGSPKP
jgi:uncharacterized coiled-coil protein SlyX